MAIRITTPNIGERLAQDVASIKMRVFRQLSHIGEECVAEAIESGDYKDHTGNLRSSIGYVVVHKGKVIDEGGFYTLGYGDEGPDRGRAKALSLARDISDTALIIVAGMDYATIVADKGYNVIDSAGLLAEKLIKTIR